MEDLAFTYPQDRSQIPDIFVNVYQKQTIGENKRIGYLRIKATEIEQYNNISWNMLKPDDFNIQDKNQVAGFLLFKASLLPTSKASSSPRTVIYLFFLSHVHSHLSNQL